MKEILTDHIQKAGAALGAGECAFSLEHPEDMAHGDYATNAALVAAKKVGKNGRVLAESLVDILRKEAIPNVEAIEIAGPGFINFRLSKTFFKKSIDEIIEADGEFGKNKNLEGKKVMVEHTDPNPFKEFHIGHLMPNAIGSTIARLFSWNGAEVKQACYQGDVGLHVAQAVWGMMKGEKDPYPAGNRAYKENEEAKKEIQEINKKIYNRSDEQINALYDKGRKASLEYFDSIYKRLGTTFDYYFFESETGEAGKSIVESNVGTVFEKSDGAVVFHAEQYDPKLHTRVFINSEGLPTYEAKELGLAPAKYEKYPYDTSVVITGNEINDYFRVLLEAMKQIFPDLAKKTVHLSHGMLKLPTGKMSSRTGDVITAEALIEEVKQKVKGDEGIAIGAIKYMILRQGVGSDIIFDMEKSVSTEGDSGVYLQYAHARAGSILKKAEKESSTSTPRSIDGHSVDLHSVDETEETEVDEIDEVEETEESEESEKPLKTPSVIQSVHQTPSVKHRMFDTLDERDTHEIERLLYRFPEVVERSGEEYAPHYLVTYLTALAASFNNFYAHEEVLGDSPQSAYRLAIVEAFATVMKNGLTILGIPAPERM